MTPLLLLVGALPSGLALLSGLALAADPSPAASPAADTAVLDSVQMRWGWEPGVVAGDFDGALAPVDPVQVALPDTVAALVHGPTALLYFSPLCPHCRHAMPELKALAALQPDLAWVLVATGSSTAEDLAEFTQTFGVTEPAGFGLVVDSDRRFAWAVGARSTPSLLLVQPAAPDTQPTSGDPVAEGMVVVTVTEAFLPYARGMAPIIAMRRNASGFRVGPDGNPLDEDPWRDFSGYQGVRACAACHTIEATSWAITHHAGAYLSLFRQDRSEDLSCVGCHVVGMDQGGFEVGDHSSPHLDVGCEACHGPSGPHDGDPGPDATTTCASCHDPEHSVAFTVEKAMPHIDHFAAASMDEATLRDRLAALTNGSAPRPMLAFEPGPTVGAATCKSCHRAQQRAWSKFSHAKAMDSLDAGHQVAGDQRDVACVRCHATPTAFGGMDAAKPTMDNLRTAEGVGCESCHGPGGAHVADPQLDNILRLGQTCPECVLEGVCTGCHVPDWDASWSLHDRLDALPCTQVAGR